MLTLTRKTDYALVALVHLAQQTRLGHPASSARTLAQQYGMPLPLLMNILKELARAKLVRSTRGAQGGYELICDPQQVGLLEIITATEGPLRLARCADGLPILGQGCELVNNCPVHKPIRKLHGKLQRFFEQITLADLMDEYSSNQSLQGLATLASTS